MQDLKCTCLSTYRSPGDYILAMRLEVDVEQAHAFGDLFENVLDEALGHEGPRDAYLQKLKEEYGRTVKASADQEDS